MSPDNSRLFVNESGKGLQFFLDPVQIPKEKRRDLLGLIRGSGGVYVPAPNDADIILTVCETDEGEKYARDYKATPVLDYDWVTKCLDKRTLLVSENWARYRIIVEDTDPSVKNEEDTVPNASRLSVNHKLPSPVSPGLKRPTTLSSTSPPTRERGDKKIIDGTTPMASVPPETGARQSGPPSLSPVAIPPTSKTIDPVKHQEFFNALTSLVGATPRAGSIPVSPIKMMSPTTLSPVVKNNQPSQSVPISKFLQSSGGGFKVPDVTKQSTAPRTPSASTSASATPLRKPSSDATKKNVPGPIATASSRLPTPTSIPSPSVKSEQLGISLSSPYTPLPIFTHAKQQRPLKLYLAGDIPKYGDWNRIVQKNGAEITQLTDCDFAIVDKGSVRLHQVVGRGKPSVSPDWIAACCREHKVLPPEGYTVDIGTSTPITPVIRTAQPLPMASTSERERSSSAVNTVQQAPPKLRIPSPPNEKVTPKVLSTKVVETVKPKLAKAKSSESVKSLPFKEKRKEVPPSISGRDSPPPRPPTKVQKSKSGHAFTEQDEEFFAAYAAWRRRREAKVGDQTILGEIARLAPHHTDTSWKNWHWRKFKKVEKAPAAPAAPAPQNDSDDDTEIGVETEPVPEPPPSKAPSPKKDVGPPPDPPKSFLPHPNGEGVQYTDVDEHYVVALGKWMLEQNPKVTLRQISEEVGRRAPHHTPTGWNRHIGLWKLFYTEHIYGDDSDQAEIQRMIEQEKEAKKANGAGPSTSPTSIPKKRPLSLDDAKPRKSHKVVPRLSTMYSFPQPKNRRGAVEFTEVDFHLCVEYVEKHPNVDRMNDKLWIRFSEEHPQFTWQKWKEHVREHGHLIDTELEQRRKEREEEEAEGEVDEVDMGIGDSD